MKTREVELSKVMYLYKVWTVTTKDNIHILYISLYIYIDIYNFTPNSDWQNSNIIYHISRTD